VATFIAVFALFGGMAYGVVVAINRAGEVSWLAWLDGFGSAPAPSPSAFVTIEPSASPSPSPSASPSPSYVPSYNYGASIRVFNDAGISGLAAKVRDHILAGGEFTNVVTDNWDGASAPANVIRYNNESLKDTAELLAEMTGISTVAFGITDAASIEIVLRSDPIPDPEPEPSPSS